MKKSNVTILSIETSCDETSMSIVDYDGKFPNNTCSVKSHIIASQANLHAEYGGVFPSLAKQEHAKSLPVILEQVLKESNKFSEKKEEFFLHNLKNRVLKWRLQKLLSREPDMFEKTWEIITTLKKPNIDFIAVTYGPGLTPALWTGISMAKALSIAWNIPLIPTNHMKGHIWSIFATQAYFKLYRPQFPLLVLLVSGGHTQIVLVRDFDDYKLLGETRDDAVGEVFDKAARALELEYPGGPKIEELASVFQTSCHSELVSESKSKEVMDQRNKGKLQGGTNKQEIKLPRPMLHTNNYEMSFSGLKTAVRLLAEKSDKTDFPAIADEFQKSVTEVLVKKTSRAIEEFNPSQLIIAGGVSANNFIRGEFEKLSEKYDIEITLPPRELTGDNALMINVAGYIKLMTQKNLSHRKSIRAHARLPYNL